MTIKFLQKDKVTAELKELTATLQADNKNLLAKVKELEAIKEDAGKTIAAFPLASKEWESKVTTLTNEIATLNTSHASALDALKAEQVTNTENLNKTWQEKLDVLSKQIADLQAEKDKLTKEHTAEVATLKEVKAEEINKAVCIKISNKGLAPNELPQEDLTATLSPEAMLAHFKTLTGKDKTDYYNANRRAILHAANKSA